MPKRSLFWCMREVLEGRWLEVTINFTSWQWGFAVEVFTSWTMYTWRLDQRVGPWEVDPADMPF